MFFDEKSQRFLDRNLYVVAIQDEKLLLWPDLDLCAASFDGVQVPYRGLHGTFYRAWRHEASNLRPKWVFYPLFCLPISRLTNL
jgi:hypothetical protein